MPNTINFEQILADIKNVVPTKLDPAHTLRVESKRWGNASSDYRVTVPREYGHDMLDEKGQHLVSDAELVTRVDNKTHDLREPAGQQCHFGGHVTWVNETTCDVTVWTD